MSESTIRDLEQISKNSKKPLSSLYEDLKVDYELKSMCFENFPHLSINELNNCYIAAKEARHIVYRLHREAYY